MPERRWFSSREATHEAQGLTRKLALRTEEEEPASRTYGGAGNRKKVKKKKRTTHVHVGPNVRAFRVGRAFCPVCNAAEGLRFTEKERESERASRPDRGTRSR